MGGVLVLAMGGTSASFVPEPRLDTLKCGTHTMTPGNRVIVESPNFPKNYNVNDRCQYEITCNAKESTYLEFICPVFQLESSSNCVHDRLIVASKGSRQTKCGSDSPNGIITSDGWTRLTFFSNAKTTAKGFRCFIWCREQTTTPQSTTTTAATTTTTPQTTSTTAAPTTSKTC